MRSVPRPWLWLTVLVAPGAADVAVAANPFTGRWACSSIVEDSRTCTDGNCTPASPRALAVDWSRRLLTVSGFSGKVKIVQASGTERQAHGLLRNFVSLRYAFVRATAPDGKPQVFFYFGDEGEPRLWDFGFATCSAQP